MTKQKTNPRTDHGTVSFIKVGNEAYGALSFSPIQCNSKIGPRSLTPSPGSFHQGPSQKYSDHEKIVQDITLTEWLVKHVKY